jgi:hypothetical protein
VETKKPALTVHVTLPGCDTPEQPFPMPMAAPAAQRSRPNSAFTSPSADHQQLEAAHAAALVVQKEIAAAQRAQQATADNKPAAAAVAASGDAVPIQDAATYAALYSMYSESSPEYREYKAEWEREQMRLRVEREVNRAQGGGARLKSRSLYSLEMDQQQIAGLHRAMSPSGSPVMMAHDFNMMSGPQRAGSGVCSPIPGGDGMLVSTGTALCMLIQSSRPASVCASPVPGYRLVKEPLKLPQSPSLYALDRERSNNLPDRNFSSRPLSPNPLSPPLSQRGMDMSTNTSQQLSYRDGGRLVSPPPPAAEQWPMHQHHQQQRSLHARTLSSSSESVLQAQQVQAATLRKQASNALAGGPTAGGKAHHRRAHSAAVGPSYALQLPTIVDVSSASFSSSAQAPSAVPASAMSASNNCGSSAQVDWAVAANKLHRLAEESELEGVSGGSNSSAISTHKSDLPTASAAAAAAASAAPAAIVGAVPPSVQLQQQQLPPLSSPAPVSAAPAAAAAAATAAVGSSAVKTTTKPKLTVQVG